MHLQHWKFKGKAKAAGSTRTSSSARISSSSSSNSQARGASQTDMADISPAKSLEVQMSEASPSTL